MHAFIAMLIASAIAGMLGGLSATDTVNAITKGFGNTLGSIGIVIGLGVMMGRILEVSGAAEQMAYSFIRFLGKKKEEWALAITGYIVSIPIFVDSAFVVLYPVAKALAKSSKRSLLTLGVALAGGLVVTHHTVPPTPGPLGVAGIFGVDLGAMLLSGIWHGHGWNFLLWGTLHGVVLVGLNIGDKILGGREKLSGSSRLGKLVAVLFPVNFVCLSFVVFRTESLADSGLMFRSLLGGGGSGVPELETLLVLGAMVLALAAYGFLAKLFDRAVALLERLPMWTWPLPMGAAMWLLMVFAPSGIPGFMYANF